jgi:hypothetical protein
MRHFRLARGVGMVRVAGGTFGLFALAAIGYACSADQSGDAVQNDTHHGAGGAAGADGAGGSAGLNNVPCDGGGTSFYCSGVCVDTSTDAKNCGGCGNACAGAEACCAGTCVEATSCAFAVTSAKPATGWQNGGDYTTLTGSGFAAGMKVFLGDGRAPVRVVSATEALVQTPPGPLGKQDIKIVSGSTTATLKGGFTYQAGSLMQPWQQKPMGTVRGEFPAVAVLQDGRVLVAGGTTVPDSATDSLDSAVVFTRVVGGTDKVDPVPNTMSLKRWRSVAVTLLDGRVLVVGNGVGDGTVADLYDPKANAFAPAKGKLAVARDVPRAVLLPDGRVLVVSSNDPSAEVFDPTTETFTTIAHTATYVYGFLVRLRDGRVLLGGGDAGNSSAELFDPDTNTFGPTGSLVQGRSMLTAHTLPDGRVFVIGGASQSAGAVQNPLASIEAYDPVAGTFSTLPYQLSRGRCWHASALVRDGTILVMGGYAIDASCTPDDTVDQVDPVNGKVTAFANLPNANTEWNAVTLLDGSVLGVGGGACGTSAALPDLDFLPGKPGPN